MSAKKNQKPEAQPEAAAPAPAPEAQAETKPEAQPEAKEDAQEEVKPMDIIADEIARHIVNPEGKTLFISKDKDCNTPIMAGGVTYSPSFDDTKTFLIWKVDAKNADYFAEHTFVKFGKIVRALER